MGGAPGDRIGRYTLVRPLGRGGTGEVWEAVLRGPRGFTRRVALKRLVSRDDSSLVREARLGAALHHPNLVAVHDLDEAAGALFVVMELVDGASAARLGQDEPLAPGALIDLGLQVCAGLSHLHRADPPVVHRDIKPTNLLVDRAGRVCIGDLGIARFAARRTADVRGTPGFIAPEQQQGQLDPRSDLYALGSTLAALAVGEPHPPPEALDAHLPGLGAVVSRCHAPLAQRWPDAAALAAALRGLRSGGQPGETLAERVARLAPAPELPDPRATSPIVARPVPALRDRSIGRQQELAQIEAALEGPHRFLTLTGLSGMGKSRLAREVGARAAGRFRGGVAWVELARAETEALARSAVAAALGASLDDMALRHALAARGGALLVLDDAAPAHRPVIEELLDAAPSLQVLCTARRPLGGAGERAVPLGPLPPAEAVALFADRAGGLEAALRPEVEQLCEAVHGLPLAIEILAGWSRTVPVARLRDRLGELLVAADPVAQPGRPERHRSVAAALEGSIATLSEPAARALGQLTVFEGGFSLEAAEAVLELGPAFALGAVHELHAASLLLSDGQRLSMHALVRARAARLDPGQRQAAERRHGQHFARFGTPGVLRELLTEAGLPRWLAMRLELDNLRAAFGRALERQDDRVAVSTALAISHVILREGSLHPLPGILELAEQRASLSERPLVLMHLASARLLTGELPQSRATVEQALALAREQGQAEVQCWALVELSRLGADTAAEALALARRAGDRLGEGHALLQLAQIAGTRWQLEESLKLNDAALAVLAEVGAEHVDNDALLYRALSRLRLGRLEEAEADVELALQIAARWEHRAQRGRMTVVLGSIAATRGEVERGLALLDEGCELLAAFGNRQAHASTLSHTVTCLGWLGRWDEAEAAGQRGLALARQVGWSWLEGHFLLLLAVVELWRGRPEQAVAHASLAVAQAPELGDPHAEAVAELVYAEVLGESGEAGASGEALERARAHASAIANPGLLADALGRLALHRQLEGKPGAGALDEATGIARTLEHPHVWASVLASEAQCALHRGDSQRAREALQRARPHLAYAPLRIHRALCQVAAALGLVEQGGLLPVGR
jgi:tetratricopeptide (TPR) repeat protein